MLEGEREGGKRGGREREREKEKERKRERERERERERRDMTNTELQNITTFIPSIFTISWIQCNPHSLHYPKRDQIAHTAVMFNVP